MSVNLYFFFFSSRRRHTRLQGDWSSDVCSSDLPAARGRQPRARLGCAGRRSAPARRNLPRRGSSRARSPPRPVARSEEHTSELQSPCNLVCRLLLEKKKKQNNTPFIDSV